MELDVKVGQYTQPMLTRLQILLDLFLVVSNIEKVTIRKTGFQYEVPMFLMGNKHM